MFAGSRVDRTTGVQEMEPGANWSFYFVAADGHTFQVAYIFGRREYPLIGPIQIPLAPLDGDVPDTAALVTAASLECPRLREHERVAVSVTQVPGTRATASVSVAPGPTWSAYLVAGQLETIVVFQCR